MTTSKRLTIFEGPDGSGKTTAAKRYANLVGAKYVHLGPLPHVKEGLARIYAEQMLAAVEGYQEVVMDRCWLSEKPYGDAFRGGDNRLHPADIRMLERLALRCQPVVVLCLPPTEEILESFRARKGEEYLESEQQLLRVVGAYQAMALGLPGVLFDWTRHTWDQLMFDIEHARIETGLHRTEVASAGNILGRVMLVGEKFAERKNHDLYHQWPFASFSSSGCSRWLTEELIKAGIDERRLLWVNADQPIDYRLHASAEKIVALGQKASERLTELGLVHTLVPHPQNWKRFHSDEVYPLIGILKEALHA